MGRPPEIGCVVAGVDRASPPDSRIIPSMSIAGEGPAGSSIGGPDHPLPAPACRAGHCQIDSLKVRHYTLRGSRLLAVGCYRDVELANAPCPSRWGSSDEEVYVISTRSLVRIQSLPPFSSQTHRGRPGGKIGTENWLSSGAADEDCSADFEPRPKGQYNRSADNRGEVPKW